MRGRLAACLVVVALTGCSGLEPREALPLPPRGHTGGEIAIASCSLAYTPNDAAHPSFLHHHPRLDAVRLGAFTGTTLQGRGCVAVAPAGSREARKLEVTVDEASVSYVGQRTGLFVCKIGIAVFVNVMIFPFCPDFPNFFIASDRFELVARARWRILDGSSGQEVARGIAQGRQSGVFGDFSRGWYYYSLVRVPSCLDEDSWEEIARVLAPGAEEALAGEIAVQVEKALLATER